MKETPEQRLERRRLDARERHAVYRTTDHDKAKTKANRERLKAELARLRAEAGRGCA